MNRPYRYHRRDILKAIGVLGAGSLLAAGGPTGAPPVAAPVPAAAENASTGKKYEGITLRMLTQAGTDYEPAFRAWSELFTLSLYTSPSPPD